MDSYSVGFWGLYLNREALVWCQESHAQGIGDWQKTAPLTPPQK